MLFFRISLCGQNWLVTLFQQRCQKKMKLDLKIDEEGFTDPHRRDYRQTESDSTMPTKQNEFYSDWTITQEGTQSSTSDGFKTTEGGEFVSRHCEPSWGKSSECFITDEESRSPVSTTKVVNFENAQTNPKPSLAGSKLKTEVPSAQPGEKTEENANTFHENGESELKMSLNKDRDSGCTGIQSNNYQKSRTETKKNITRRRRRSYDNASIGYTSLSKVIRKRSETERIKPRQNSATKPEKVDICGQMNTGNHQSTTNPQQNRRRSLSGIKEITVGSTLGNWVVVDLDREMYELEQARRTTFLREKRTRELQRCGRMCIRCTIM